jgi:hypothetical protein
MKTAEQRIAAVVEQLNPSYRTRMGYTHLDVYVIVSVQKDGWSASVECKRIADNLPSLEAALDALEAHGKR